MRPYILRALLVKEVHRHIANRGGIVLCLLLIVAALLLSVFNPGAGAGGTGGGALIDGVHRCMVQYPDENAFIQALKDSLPDDMQAHVMFDRQRSGDVTGMMTYAPGTGAIQIRMHRDANGVTMKVEIWHPPEKPEAMAPYEAWFWRAARDALQKQAAEDLAKAGIDPKGLTQRDPRNDDLWAIRDSYRQLSEEVERLKGSLKGTGTPLPAPLPKIEIERNGLGAPQLDLRSAIATGMVVFSLYFFCVYLLPTMTCEERERGVLLAQALSPASPIEILAAKFLFYPTLGITMAAVLAGIYKPALLSTLFFWMALLSMGSGFLGIGMTVATLAKTQRAAFMGSMCYLMSVALILFICQQNGIPGIPYMAIEYHGPRIIHAAITGEIYWYHYFNLLGEAGLGLMWMTIAGQLFRRRGWQ